MTAMRAKLSFELDIVVGSIRAVSLRAGNESGIVVSTRHLTFSSGVNLNLFKS